MQPSAPPDGDSDGIVDSQDAEPFQNDYGDPDGDGRVNSYDNDDGGVEDYDNDNEIDSYDDSGY